tara:strand:+ start:41905 stop:43227 length:1323 start_codon:yes stop_codon:yes gene_type:complete
MKKILSILLALYALQASAQHTISGSFSPAEEYSWLIAYRLTPDAQVYVADSAIKNGSFTLNLPEDAESGMYRIVYAVPQEEFNFDILYNAKENIVIDFDANKGLGFTQSEENILLNTYLAELAQIEAEIIQFYSAQETDTTTFNSATKKLKAHQNLFETKSEGLLAHNFIRSNKPYIPTKYEPVQKYVAHKKAAYFEAIDFSNPVLQSSGFLTDKVSNYAFTALSLTQQTKKETEDDIIKNIAHFSSILSDVASVFKFYLYNDLWKNAIAYDYNEVADFIYSKYLKELAETTNHLDIKTAIEAHNRLRLGEIAPEMVWKDGGNEKSLRTLEPFENYILIFWSSTCGHCLNELPALHKELKGNSSLKIIAVGLEDETENWQIESKNLPNFEHLIALGKWDSAYANLYDINATPTYYILDSEKRIIAKPENDRALVEFLESK